MIESNSTSKSSLSKEADLGYNKLIELDQISRGIAHLIKTELSTSRGTSCMFASRRCYVLRREQSRTQRHVIPARSIDMNLNAIAPLAASGRAHFLWFRESFCKKCLICGVVLQNMQVHPVRSRSDKETASYSRHLHVFTWSREMSKAKFQETRTVN